MINKLFRGLPLILYIRIRRELFLLKEDKEIMEVSKIMKQIKVINLILMEIIFQIIIII